MKNLTFKTAMLNDSRTTVNRQSTDGQSQRHCKQTPLSKRWKVLMTLVFLFTLGIGNVWGATGDATTSAAPASGGTTKDYANTISVASGYVDGNVIYYISNNLTFISGWGIEANYLGIIFKPTVDLTLDFEGFNNNSNNVNITYQIDSIADAAFFDVFANAGDAKISDKIVADNGGGSAASNNVTLNYWKDNGVVKYSNKTWQSNGDNAPKNLAGQQNTTFFGNTRLVTNAVAAITSTKSTAAGSYSFMRGTKKFVFKAGKIYRIYAVRGSSKTGFKSFTFTPVYQLTWNFDEGASSETAGTDYTATGYYVKNATLAYPSDESMSKYGFVFDGWSSSATKMPASALTITAQWAALGSCVATAPGAITKGAASEGVLTLTAEGTPADNNTWYWQDAADGTATDKGSGATKNVNAAGTYYLRSFNDDGGSGCWSAAKSVTVAAEDLLTAITPNLSYDANVIVGNTLSPTLTGNAGNGTVVYTLNDVTPAGSLTINESTGVVTAVTAGGTATVTATIAANGNYAGNTATSGTITAFANPLGTHTITYTLSPINTSDASLTSTQVSTSTYLKNLTTIDASSCGFASSPSAGKNRTAKINRASSGKDNNKFVYLTFNVESGYQFTPTSIVIKVANVSNVTTFDAALISSDGPSVGEEEKSFSSTDGSVETWTIANEAGTALTGTVTLKIWPYANSAGSFRFGTPITITGTVAAEETKYDLSFAAGTGASGSMSTLKYAEGAEVTLPACTFTAPDSKEFDAWVVTKTASGDPGSVSAGKCTMPAEAVTATATWKAVTPKYHVTYDGNSKTSGSVPTDATAYEANAQVTVLGKGDLARIIDGNAATFYGWNTKADMTGTHYDAGANFNIQNANVTLYAEWGYSIEYKLNNGSWKSGYTAPDHYIYGKGVTLPTAENVERVGFEFDGWYSEWHVINDGGYIDANKRTAVGPSDYGNASYLASWTALPLGKAQSVDLEGLVEDEGTGANWQAYMTSHGYEYSTESVSLDEKKDPSENKAYDNWPYQGLKMKKTGSYVQGTVDAGKLVIIKLGHMAAAANVTIGGVAQANATGLDAAEPAGKYNYYYVASESVLRYETNSNDACVLKAITITDPYQVTFNANGGDPVAAQYGHPSVTLPSATNGSQIFLGWFTEETDGTKIGEANESYTPSADITLYAHWEAVSSDARLASISFSSAAGTLSPAFNPEEVNYTYTMPYGTAAIPTITGATSVHANAQDPIIGDAATAWGEAQTIKGVAESGDKKTYTITMLQAPKDGVAIISIDVPTGNGNVQTIAADNISGFIGGTATQKLQNGTKKLGSNGNYIGFTLANSEELQAGDVIRLNVSATNGASHLTLYQDGSDANLVKDIEWTATTGVNLIPIPSEAVGLSTLYIYRKSSECNPTLSEFAILRPMDPVMTAITINGRDGEIDPLDDKHFSVTIPFESELDNLTVVPEVVWNAAHATTPTAVVSNGGEWVLAAYGDNTYRIMDKDGDHTDYTITLTRDVKKYTVTFNAQGGSTVEPKLVVEKTKLDAAPADPTREDYQFLGWAEATEGEVVDVTDIVISANKTFYAQWKYEDPIVMLDGEGHIDHVNFLTGLSEGTVNFGSADHKCVSFGSGNSTIVGKTGANKYIVYNAKTNKTRIKFVLYNKQNSPKNLILQKLAEGETETTDVVIEVPSKQLFTTEYYTYNSDDNRTMYVCSENTDIKVLQVKVIESGTPVKQAGEAGYSLNFNVGRVFAPSGSDVVYDGLAMKASSNYQVLTSEEFPTQSNLSFQVNELVTMTLVSTGAKYKVSKNPAGSGKEYAAGTNKHTLTQGTWYIVSSTSSNMKFTNISFEEPVADYTRDNLNPSFLGTLCWTNDAILGGATLYEFAGKNENNYLVFDEVISKRLEAGKPYIFMPENGNTEIKLYNTDDAAPLTENQPAVKHMYGTVVAKDLYPTTDVNMYYFSSNHIWAVKDFTSVEKITVPAYYCYIDYPAVLADEPANSQPAPGRRRVTMGVQGEQVVTGMGEIKASETPMKVMIDGQLFIIRGEKMFDATGRLVK